MIDLKKPLLPQAEAAVEARDASHHIDENEEPKDSGFEQAYLDKFAIGTAVKYDGRYKDVGYLSIRGREQQLIDYRGKAQSDTKPGPAESENAIRAVAKDNKFGRIFHDAATAWFKEELHRYTGY